MHHIGTLVHDKTPRQWFTELYMGNNRNTKCKKIVCQLDCGATCNVMNYNDYCSLVGNQNPEITKNKVTLRFYDGGTKQTLGHVKLWCLHSGKKFPLYFQIIEGKDKPLISAKSCVKMNLIVVNAKLVQEAQSMVNQVGLQLSEENILQDYRDVFTGLGCLEGEHHIEIDKSITPVKHHPRRVPAALKAEVKEKIDQMTKAGILAKVTKPSDWISSMVVIKTPKKLRICLDPKDLNKAIKRAHYLLPTIEEMLPELHAAKIFSVCDAKDGYLQVRLDEASSDLTTFWTPFGRYKWLRLPFGISSAPEEYQRRLHELLEGLPGVEVIADDILVFGCGDTEEEALRDHDEKLIQLLQRARDVGLKLNKDKLKLRLTEVQYMGHLLTNKGLKADPNKTEAIAIMPRPMNLTELQRVIGFVNYLAKFLPRLSDVTKPLRDLMNATRIKEDNWTWDDIHEESFQNIKRLAASTPVLQYYNVRKPVTIQCDASEYGLGAALLQDGKPVAYASKALTKTEQNYAQIEKECLAIVFACERFSQYLSGQSVINVDSDHKPLEIIFKKTILTAPRRLQRMLLRLQRFNLNVQYKKGCEMYIADLLSRTVDKDKTADGYMDKTQEEIYKVHKEESIFEEIRNIDLVTDGQVQPERMRRIQLATSLDKTLQALTQVITKGWPDAKSQCEKGVQEFWNFREELSIQNGIIFKGVKIVVPSEMRHEMLTRLHAPHLGIEASLRKAREVIYWPHMVEDINNKVNNCDICQEAAPKQKCEPMLTHPTPQRPWERIAVDIFTVNGDDYLIMVDYYSDYWEVDKLSTTSAEAIIKRCKVHFSAHGIPDIMDTDRGTQLDCKVFKKFSEEWEFSHCTSSPYYHQANGKAESAVKIAKKIVKRTRQDGTDLQLAILEWRNTPSQGMQSSPAQRLLSRRTRTLIPVAPKLLYPRVEKDVPEKINEKKQKYKRHYDRTSKPLPPLSYGQNIRVQLNPERRAEPWRPGTITASLGSRSYIVDVNGHQFRRNRRDIRPQQQAQGPSSKSGVQPDQEDQESQAEVPASAHEASSTVMRTRMKTGCPIIKPARYT